MLVELDYLSTNTEWRDQETSFACLKKKSLSETTEEDIDEQDIDDEEADVDADIPADDDDQQVMDTLYDHMLDDLAEAWSKVVWLKKGEKKSDIPGSS